MRLRSARRRSAWDLRRGPHESGHAAEPPAMRPARAARSAPRVRARQEDEHEWGTRATSASKGESTYAHSTEGNVRRLKTAIQEGTSAGSGASNAAAVLTASSRPAQDLRLDGFVLGVGDQLLRQHAARLLEPLQGVAR